MHHHAPVAAPRRVVPTPSRVGILVLVGAVLLGGCASEPGAAGTTDASGTANGDAGEQVEVTFTFFGDAIEARGYEDMVAAFEAANPDVDVLTEPVASKSDLLARLTTSFAGGNPPDLFLVNFREFGQFAAAGVLEPLQDRVEASAVLALADLYPQAVDAFRFGGPAQDVTCLPQNVSSLVAYVNLDLFAAADLDVPHDGWTWDDLRSTAQLLTDTDADVFGLGTSPSLIRLAPFVWSNGGEVVDDPLAPTRLTILDSPAALEAVDTFLNLSLVDQVVPGDVAEQSFDSEARFLAGRLGVYLNSRRAVPTLRTITDFGWDVVPLPVAPDGAPVTMLHSDAYCLSAAAGAEDPAVADAAFRLVEFALGPDGAPITAASGRTVPSNIAIATSEVFLDGQPPVSSQVFLDNAEIVRATPSTASWARVEKLADDLLTEIWYGRVPRDEGLQRLVDESSAIFAEGDGASGT